MPHAWCCSLTLYPVYRQPANQQCRRGIRRALSVARSSRPRHLVGLRSRGARYLRFDRHRDMKTRLHVTPPATDLSSRRQSERRRPAPSGQALPRCTRANSPVAQTRPSCIRSGPDGVHMHLPQCWVYGPSATKLHGTVIGAPRHCAGACCIRLPPADKHLHDCCDRVLQPQASIFSGWSCHSRWQKESLLQLTTHGACTDLVPLDLHRITTALPAITTPGSIMRADATAASP